MPPDAASTTPAATRPTAMSKRATPSMEYGLHENLRYPRKTTALATARITSDAYAKNGLSFVGVMAWAFTKPNAAATTKTISRKYVSLPNRSRTRAPSGRCAGGALTTSVDLSVASLLPRTVNTA